MEKVGVSAVVDGLSTFLGGMKKVDKAIAGIVPTSSLLGKALSGLGGIVSHLTNSVFRIFEYVLGNLIADAIRFVTDQIRDLVVSTIEAGQEFQTLELRLKNLNFNSLVESGMDLDSAMQQSIETTKEQLAWLQKLAVTTPYDLSEIASTFTLARGYGFSGDDIEGAADAKDLTKAILDFSAGMGLGNAEIERIITNFGQMQQQGKVTATEMRDLARGAFVPVNDILKMMQEETGLTGEAFEAFRNSGEGVEMFMNTFIKLTDTRFASSTEAMARTWKGATDNLKDFVKSMVGLNIVKPILDTLGGNVADFLSAFSTEGRISAFQVLFEGIGKSAQEIISGITGIGPSADELAGKFQTTLGNIARWLKENKDEIIAWAQGVSNWINTQAIPAIQGLWDWLFGNETQSGAIQGFGDWLKNDFIPLIQDASVWVSDVLVPFLRDDLIPVFQSLLPLASAVGGVLLAVLGTEPDQSLSDWIHETLIPAIENLTQWIEANKETIAKWVKIIGILIIAFTIVMGVISAVIGFVVGLISAIVGIVAVVSAAGAELVIFATILIGIIVAAIILVITTIVVFGKRILEIPNKVKEAVNKIVEHFKTLKTRVISSLNEIITSAKNFDWSSIGLNMVTGMINGIKNNASALVDTVKNLVQSAVAAATTALGIDSPSKVFWDIGKDTGLGLIQGITSMYKRVQDSVKDMANATIMAGINMPTMMASQLAPSSTVNNTTNNSYNLNVQSASRSEPIISDFAMMQSLGG